MDWKLYTDKYNNRFEHFLSVQIVQVGGPPFGTFLDKHEKIPIKMKTLG